MVVGGGIGKKINLKYSSIMGDTENKRNEIKKFQVNYSFLMIFFKL